MLKSEGRASRTQGVSIPINWLGVAGAILAISSLHHIHHDGARSACSDLSSSRRFRSKRSGKQMAVSMRRLPTSCSRSSRELWQSNAVSGSAVCQNEPTIEQPPGTAGCKLQHIFTQITLKFDTEKASYAAYVHYALCERIQRKLTLLSTWKYSY